MLDALKEQYDWIKSARNVLFTFLDQLPPQKLHEVISDFGNRSIIGTHIHAADSYRYWLGSFAYMQHPADFSFATDREVTSSEVDKVRERFALVDGVVERFLDKFNNRWHENIENNVFWMDEKFTATPLFLLTHTETHEFHHKGQILSMARHLGFPPEDDRMGGLFS